MTAQRRAWIGGLLILPWALLASCGTEREPDCEFGKDDLEWEQLETRCDGIDNDCDGLTDVLARLDANACIVDGAQGACEEGFKACFGASATCMAPPPVHEAENGVDDDCNGKVDDLGSGQIRPLRARILMPPYMWADDPGNTVLYSIQTALEQAGIPYDSVQPGDEDRKADWAEGFYELDQHAMVIIPGYVMPSYIKDDFYIRLRQYVEGGGMLVWFKALGPGKEAKGNDLASQLDVATLGGFTGHHVHMTATRVAIQASVPGVRGLDSLEERSIRLSGGSTVVEIETLTYDLDPKSDVTVFGMAMKGNIALGPTLLRNRVGAGAVYTLGYDPSAATAFRCFVNCFDPGRDILTVLLRDMFREAGGGHVVLKHSVPGTEDGVFIPTHDVDAPDAFNDGAWGTPGALRMAQMEQAEGVKGTYFITTDYVAAYYNSETVLELCDLGMCPAGGHSVQHLYWESFPKGTCQETRASYVPTSPSVCGEVRVNLELLRNLLPKGTRLDTWRTPYLEVNAHMYDVLAANGVRYDSSLGNGDVRTNFPFHMANFPWLQEELFHHHDMLEFGVTLEDGMGWYEGATEKRLELTKRSWPFFRGLWIRTILENAANGATTVLLVHPSYGVGGDSDSENTVNKINAVEWAIRFSQQHGLRVETMAQMGDFWLGRRGTRIDAKWDAKTGYSGKLTVGAEAAPRLTLAFSDHVTVFQCPGVGKVDIAKGRVVLTETLKPGFSCDFTARVE